MSLPATASEGRNEAGGSGESRLHRLLGPIASTALGILIVALAQQIAEPAVATSFSPRWWPEITGIAITLLSIGVGIRELIRPARPAPDDVQPATGAGWARIALVLAAVVAYGALWYVLDFRIVTFLLLAALVLILGGRGWKAYLLFPAICTAVLYGLFGLLLRVPL